MTEHLKIKKNKKFKYMTTLEKAKLWLSDTFDAETRATVQNWIDTNSPELEDSFYRELEFGTGGMRGIMGKLSSSAISKSGNKSSNCL